jgi:hypothetical protein
MHKRILLPLDGSAMADQALSFAVAQAERFQAGLILLRALDPFPHTRGMSPADIEAMRQQAHEGAREYLDSVTGGAGGGSESRTHAGRSPRRLSKGAPSDAAGCRRQGGDGAKACPRDDSGHGFHFAHLDTREIAVQAALEADSLEEGYEVTRLRLSPPVVTLTGRRSALETAGDFVVTVPITLTGIRSELTLDVPLVLTDRVSALDAQGEPVNSVVARVKVVPVTDYLVLAVRPILSSEPLSLTVQLSPDSVSVLLIGPKPLLGEIQNGSALVTASVDLRGYAAGTHLLPLEIHAPGGFERRLVPARSTCYTGRNGLGGRADEHPERTKVLR